MSLNGIFLFVRLFACCIDSIRIETLLNHVHFPSWSKNCKRNLKIQRKLVCWDTFGINLQKEENRSVVNGKPYPLYNSTICLTGNQSVAERRTTMKKFQFSILAPQDNDFADKMNILAYLYSLRYKSVILRGKSLNFVTLPHLNVGISDLTSTQEKKIWKSYTDGPPRRLLFTLTRIWNAGF